MYETSYQYLEENELEHFGIKGMKWGVRRTPEELGHRKAQKAAKRAARAEKVKATAKKAAAVAKKYGPAVVGGAALAVFGGASMKYAIGSQVGKAAIRTGSQVLSRVLRSNSGMAYKDLQSIGAQKLTQILSGTATRNSSDGWSYRNLQSIAAQKAQQDIRRPYTIGPSMNWDQAMDYLFNKK